MASLVRKLRHGLLSDTVALSLGNRCSSCHGFSAVRRSSSSWTPPTDVNIDKIKAEFHQIGGGYVSLSQTCHGGIAHLCFGNPFRKNAISGRMMCELHDAVTTDLKDLKGCKAVVFMSDDPSFFCSGGDLDTVKKIFSRDGGYKMATLMHDILWNLSFSELLTVTLVRGRAIGGGAELCTATDLRVFSPDANIQFVQAQMGVATGWGGGARLSAIVGRRRALRYMLDARKISALDAKAVGLCDHVTQADGHPALDEAESWLRHLLADTGGQVVSTVKAIASDLEKQKLKASLENEKVAFAKLWSGKAHKQALDLNLKH